jgi:predicted RNA binding protein YcfA (HicA-like mRNA interferase family)
VSKQSFPSMKANDLLAVLMRAPLSYTIVRQEGSHRQLRATGRPGLLFSYGKGATVPPGVVRKILVKDVGLSAEEALSLL